MRHNGGAEQNRVVNKSTSEACRRRSQSWEVSGREKSTSKHIGRPPSTFKGLTRAKLGGKDWDTPQKGRVRRTLRVWKNQVMKGLVRHKEQILFEVKWEYTRQIKGTRTWFNFQFEKISLSMSWLRHTLVISDVNTGGSWVRGSWHSMYYIYNVL